MRVLEAHGQGRRSSSTCLAAGWPSSASSCSTRSLRPTRFSRRRPDPGAWVIRALAGGSPAMQERSCLGFVGSAVIGLSFVDDVRPHEQAIEFWEGPVQPEIVVPTGTVGTLAAAQRSQHLSPPAAPRPQPENPAQVQGGLGRCMRLYDTAKLRAVGGYSFWQRSSARAQRRGRAGATARHGDVWWLRHHAIWRLSHGAADHRGRPAGRRTESPGS